MVPKLSGAWEWLLQQRDLGARYLAEGTANSAANQLRNYGVGLILGLAAVGYLQAAGTLMGPFMVIFFGMGLVALPEAARILRRSPRHMALFCGLFSVGLALLALAWGVMLLVALPRGLGQWLLGRCGGRPTRWCSRARIRHGRLRQCGAGTGLHALGAARRSLRGMTVASVVYVIGAVTGTVTGGAVGTMRGAAIAAWIGAFAFWWELRGAMRDYKKAAAEKPSRPTRESGRSVEPSVAHSS